MGIQHGSSFEHGAKKVIGVESNRKQISYLKANKERFGWNLDIYEEKFDPEKHLVLDHDFIKCDIEGYEMELLPYVKTLKPCVVEVHNLWEVEQFQKAGFQLCEATYRRPGRMHHGELPKAADLCSHVAIINLFS